MKRALVLGSSGFIGGHLVKVLMDDGYWVRGCDVRPVQHALFHPSDFVKGDLRDISIVRQLFDTEPFDEVFQLAADMGGATYINCGFYDGSVMSNSVTINVNVAKCATEFNAKKLFFSSSACVYPHTNDDVALCRETDAYPASPDNEYGWEKLFSERMYKAFEKQYGLNVFIARFHSIVGDYSVWSNDRSKAHAALIHKVIKVEDGGVVDIIGDGTQIRTFLYVRDCIRGIRMLMDSNCKKIMNIGSDDCISINQYVGMLKSISGKNFSIRYVDGATGVKFRYCCIDEMRKECGWSPQVSTEESARITYNFILEQMKSRKKT